MNFTGLDPRALTIEPQLFAQITKSISKYVIGTHKFWMIIVLYAVLYSDINVRYENIIKRALYDENGEETDCGKLFESACQEMHKLIHNKLKVDSDASTSQCSDYSDYNLIIYYSGHGKGREDHSERDCAMNGEIHEDGSWVPYARKNKDGTWDERWIKLADIDKHTLSIKECTNDEHSCR